MKSSEPSIDWLAAIEAVRVPTPGAAALSSADVSKGLDQVARLRGELALVQAQLVALRAVEARRDTTASIARQLGLTKSEARAAADVAEVLAAHPHAGVDLASGAIQPGHLAALSHVSEATDQAALLVHAPEQTVEEFRSTVRQFRIAQAGPGWRDRQRAARSVRFFQADNGCLGMRALLPDIDGALLRERLRDIVDAAYRREHPERAEALGGHGADKIEQRMADALVSLAHGTATDSGPARASVVVLVDPQRRTAEILGDGPIAFDDAVDLAADEARAEIYGIMQDTKGAVLKFGRNRRFASALQRLAIAVRDRVCVVAGCGRSAVDCDAHHEPPFEDGGRTDVDAMEARCSLHHAHRHETGETGPLRSAKPAASAHDPPTSIAA